jgi:leader peptidase (prepilin peptidase) / N-methyltransferase
LIPNSLFLILAVAYGLIIGSFLNALVWRVYVGKSIAKGRSMCPHCKHELMVMDLLPVLSWLMLGGKCRYCKKPISLQYPLVELATGVLFALSYLLVGPVGLIGWLEFIIWLYVLSSLVFLAVYDLKWMLLPNVVLIPAIGIQLGWVVVRWLLGAPTGSLTGPLFAAVAAGLGFLVLALLANGRLMGLGDVKLVLLMGLVLGVKNMIVALLIGFNAAAFIGVILMILGRKKRTDYLPFGPFLVLGTIVAYVYGAPIVNWYLQVNAL